MSGQKVSGVSSTLRKPSFILAILTVQVKYAQEIQYEQKSIKNNKDSKASARMRRGYAFRVKLRFKTEPPIRFWTPVLGTSLKLAHIQLVRRPAGTKALHILSRKNCADMDVGEALNMRVYAVYKLGVRIVQDV